MKTARILSAALLVSLLLTGCGRTGTPKPVQSEAPVQTVEPAAETPSPTPDRKVSVTSSGVKVQVDYSAYTAGRDMQNRYTRLQEDWIGDLQPSDDYGSIYPYVGGITYSGYDGVSYVSGYVYGMIDENGRIIADPTYMDVEVPSYINYETGERVNLPFWVLGRGEQVKTAPDEYAWAEENYTIASMDGKFVSETGYRNVRGYDFGLWLSGDWEDDSFTMIDRQGNVLLTEKDCKLPTDCQGQSFHLWDYGEGLFTVCVNDKSFYYMDMEGNFLFGPYDYAMEFSCGRGVVQVGESYGVIDHTGKWIVEPGVYREIGAYRQNLALAFQSVTGDFMDGSLLDVNGKQVITLPKGIANANTNANGNFVIQRTMDGDYDVCDREGHYLYSFNYNKSYPMGNTDILTTENGSDLLVQNPITGAEMHLKVREHLVHGCGKSSEGYYSQPIHYLLVMNREDDEWYKDSIYDVDTFEKLMDCDGTVYETVDPVTGKVWLKIEAGNEKNELMTLDLQKVGAFNGRVSVYNDRILVTNEEACRYYDLDGNELFAYSLALSYEG